MLHDASHTHNSTLKADQGRLMDSAETPDRSVVGGKLTKRLLWYATKHHTVQNVRWSFMKMTKKMQLCRIIYYSLAALHVSKRYFRVSSGASKLYLQLLVLHTSVAAGWYHRRVGTPFQLSDDTNRQQQTCVIPEAVNKYSVDAPDDERKHRSKHVEQPRNNKLSYTVASSWSSS
jgi:hypothetical protein